MLTSLSLENFKAFGVVQVVPLARVTLIYGPNSAGKSCIIQALRCLKQSVESSGAASGEFVTNGPLARLGEFGSLVHNRRPRLAMRFGIRCSQGGTLIEVKKEAPPEPVTSLEPTEDEDFEENYLAIDRRWARGGRVERVSLVAANGASLAFLHNGPKVWDRGYTVDSDRAVSDLMAWLEASLSSDAVAAQETREAAERYIQAMSTSGEIPFFDSEFLLPGRRREIKSTFDEIPMANHDEANDPVVDYRAFANRKVAELSSNIERALRACIFVGPTRHMPTGVSFDEDGLVAEADLGAPGLAQVLYGHPDALLRLNESLARCDLPYEVVVKRVQLGFGSGVALHLMDRNSKIRLQLRDVGYGCSQLLPVLLAGICKWSTVCVEQPELHLHPRQQGHLTDLFIDSSGPVEPMEGHFEGPSQWIVETHSEAIASRLQRRVREGKVRPDEVAVLYVEPSSAGSRVMHLRMDERGEFLDSWPNGFFEETYWDLFGGRQ